MSGRRVLTDNDVFVKAGKYQNQSITTALAGALSEYDKRISKLESNAKWLYKYGGLGTGGGGGGGGSSTKFQAVIVAELGDRGEQQLYSGQQRNSLSYPDGHGVYSFRVNIYKGGGSTFRVAYTAGGGQSGSNDNVTPQTGYEWRFSVRFDRNQTLRITVQNLTDPDEAIVGVDADIVVDPYSFSIDYVYCDGSGQYNPTNNNIFMSDVKDKGIKARLKYEMNVSPNQLVYKYTDWEGNASGEINAISEQTDPSKRIEVNNTGAVYLDLIPETADTSATHECIKAFLSDNANAATKMFNVELSVKTNSDTADVIQLKLLDTVIPSDLYLKILQTQDDGQFYEQYTEISSYYKYDAGEKKVQETSLDSIPDGVDVKEALSHSQSFYTVPAEEGIVVRQDEQYFKVRESEWVRLRLTGQDDDTYTFAYEDAGESASGFTVHKSDIHDTLDHGRNYYAIPFGEENCYIVQHGNPYPTATSFHVGQSVGLQLTPFDGAMGASERKYQFTFLVDGWPMNMDGSSILTERRTTSTAFTIPSDGRPWHKLEFILADRQSTDHEYRKTYYVGAVDFKKFEWYKSDIQDQSNFYSSYYRHTLGSQKITDKDGKPLDYENVISQTSAGATRRYKFNACRTPDGELLDVQNYDQMFSIGVQYSSINDFSKEIFTIGVGNGQNNIHVYQDKIRISRPDAEPYEVQMFFLNAENDVKASNLEKYHLLQFLAHQEKLVAKDTSATCKSVTVYIDGVLSHVFTNFINVPCFDYVELCPGNYFVNLIEAAALYNQEGFQFGILDPVRYFCAYDENVLHHFPKDADGMYDEGAEAKKLNAFKVFESFTLTKDNYVKITSIGTFKDVAQGLSMPSLIVNCNSAFGENYDKDHPEESDMLIRSLHQSYEEDQIDDAYYDSGTLRYLNTATLDWTAGNGSAWETIKRPGGSIEAQAFNLELQGSSTLNYRCKNFELYCQARSDGPTEIDGVLCQTYFSPNFKAGDGKSFLPERSFTLKADAVDSTHSNNTVMGKFINDVMTPFEDALNAASPGGSSMRQYVKTCLTGFPILLVLHTANTDPGTKEPIDTYYYLGVYNFNLGRKSYFNLGYYNVDVFSDSESSSGKIKLLNGFKTYHVPIASAQLLESVGAAEVQGNNSHYDFSQYNTTVLYSINSGDKERMFDDFVANSKQLATLTQTAIPNFVKRIAYAGGAAFELVGKTMSEVSSDSYGYDTPYTKLSADGQTPAPEVPNFRYQARADFGGGTVKQFFHTLPRDEVASKRFQNLKEAVQQCTAEDSEETIYPAVDYTSLVEYYTICMAFAMVDSVQKNLNIKTWTLGNQNRAPTFYIAFYDMDTCLGLNNKGTNLLYYAFSDYWRTKQSVNETIQETDVYYDFSPKKLEPQHADEFYDTASSYLFAIAKYAHTIYSNEEPDSVINVNRSPNSVWYLWRHANSSQYDSAADPAMKKRLRGEGCLRNAAHFVEAYYKNHLQAVPMAAFTLNYVYKYLVYGSTDSQTGNVISFDTRNSVMLHGRRIGYVTDWLDKRIHLLDAYFNITSLPGAMPNTQRGTPGEPEYSPGVMIPRPDSAFAESGASNPDIYVNKDIFTAAGTKLRVSDNVTVNVKGVPYSVLLPTVQSASKGRYMLPENQTHAYTLNLAVSNQDIRLAGSQALTYIDDVGQFIDAQQQKLYVKSPYLEELHGVTKRKCSTWDLEVPMLKVFDFTGDVFSGKVGFSGENNKQLSKIDISRSSINLGCSQTDTLNTLSATNCDGANIDIQIDNIGDNTLKTVGINGKFRTISMPAWSNNVRLPTAGALSCSEINLTNRKYKNASVSITAGLLSSLTLDGFENVTITNCPSLKWVKITDGKEDFKLKKLNVSFPSNSVGTYSGFSINSGSAAEPNGCVNLSAHEQLNQLTIQYATFRTIVLPPSKIKLPASAFAGCVNLSALSVQPDTELSISGPGTFSGCKSIGFANVRNSAQLSSCLTFDAGVTNLGSTFENYLAYSNNQIQNNFNLQDAVYFLKRCKDTKINENITNIDYLFDQRSGIVYGTAQLLADLNAGGTSCQLKLDFPKALNANEVFDETGVKCFSKAMFDRLAISCNADATLTMSTIGRGGDLSVTQDFLYPVIRKLRSFNLFLYQTPDQAESNSMYSSFRVVEKSGTALRLKPVISAKDMFTGDSKNKPVNLTSIYSFNTGSQPIDLSGMFADPEINWTSAAAGGITLKGFGGQSNSNTANTEMNVFVRDGWADVQDGNIQDGMDVCNPFNTFLRDIPLKDCVACFKNVKFCRHRLSSDQNGQPATVEGPDEEIRYVYDASNVENCTASAYVDLGKFIDWKNLAKTENLFNCAYTNYPSLAFNKKIPYSKGQQYSDGISSCSFTQVWDNVALSSGKLRSMCYVFDNANILIDGKYCSTDDGYEIDGTDYSTSAAYRYGHIHLNSKSVREDDSNRSINTTLSSIPFLFRNAKFMLGEPGSADATERPITFTSDFFGRFKNIRDAREAFKGIYLLNTLPYNFFNKASVTSSTVYVTLDDASNSRLSATLVRNQWNTDMTNLTACFAGARFIKNIAFCPSAEYNTYSYSADYLISNGTRLDGVTRYYDTPTSLDPSYISACFPVTDCYISTDYAPTHSQNGNNLGNFEIRSNNELCMVINKVFVAPDILYGAADGCKIDGMFQNSAEDGTLTFAGQTSPQSFTTDYHYENLRTKISTQSKNSPTFTGALPQHMLQRLNGDVTLKNTFDRINVLPTYVGAYYTQKTLSSTYADISGDHTISTTYLIPHACYSFVPSGFSKQRTLESAFNFKIFIPEYSKDISSGNKNDFWQISAIDEAFENPFGCSKKYVDYFIMMYDSIPAGNTGATSLRSALPSTGCSALYQPADQNTDVYVFNIDYAAEHRIIRYPIRYYSCGTPTALLSDDGNALTTTNGDVLSTMQIGFDCDRFNLLYFDDVIKSGLARVMNGTFFKEGTSYSKVNVNQDYYVVNIAETAGQLNRNLRLPFSTDTTMSDIAGKMINSSYYNNYQYEKDNDKSSYSSMKKINVSSFDPKIQAANLTLKTNYCKRNIRIINNN